jgi:hypothetical protein
MILLNDGSKFSIDASDQTLLISGSKYAIDSNLDQEKKRYIMTAKNFLQKYI